MSLGLPLGATSRRACPSGVIHWSTSSGGRLSRVTSCALSSLAQVVERRFQRLHESRVGALAGRRIGLGKRRHRRGETLGGVGAGTRRSGSKLIERIDRAVDDRDVSASVGGGLSWPAKERGSSVSAALWISGSFLLLIVGMNVESVVTRATCGSARSLTATSSAAASDGSSASILLAPPAWSVSSCKIGRDRFDVRIAQIHRIEIEPQPIEQRRRAEDDERGHDEDRRRDGAREIRRPAPGTCSRAACGSLRGLSTLSRAGNNVMLVRNAISMPKPAIRPSSDSPRYAVGRKARKPAAVASAASVSGAPARRPACSSASMQTVDFVPFGSIADAELNAEIDPETDEQHGEVNRNQVEARRPSQCRAPRSPTSPTTRLTKTAKMIRPPAQRQPQDEQHDRNRHASR